MENAGDVAPSSTENWLIGAAEVLDQATTRPTGYRHIAATQSTASVV